MGDRTLHRIARSGVPDREGFIERVRKPPPMPGEALPALEIANRDGPEE